MPSQELRYTDGRSGFVGRLIWDGTRSERRPGVLVFPEAYGLNAHTIARAERLAEMGYVALAADIYGAGLAHDDLSVLIPAIKALYADRAGWRDRARAAFDALAAQASVDPQRMAAIGFCLGGATCFELGRSGVPLVAITAFHASIQAELPDDAGRLQARVLICHGDEDPLIAPEALETVLNELRRDRVDWMLARHGGTVHSFTDPRADARHHPSARYNPTADARSWAVMTRLLEEVFV